MDFAERDLSVNLGEDLGLGSVGATRRSNAGENAGASVSEEDGAR